MTERSRGNEPAFPDRGSPHGMTIREKFAGMAMQGLIARPGSDMGLKTLAEGAVEFADALLAALGKTP